MILERGVSSEEPKADLAWILRDTGSDRVGVSATTWESCNMLREGLTLSCCSFWEETLLLPPKKDLVACLYSISALFDV
jgi:hypothetical protein